MKVEVATAADAPEIAQLGSLLHAESSYAAIPYSLVKVEALMRTLANGEGVIFIVRSEGEIVGGIAGGVSAHWFSDELLGFEYSFFIRPDVRHGITAVRLVNAFKAWCELRGAKQIRMGITTDINAEGTAKLYRFLGFQDAGSLFKMEL